MNTLFLAHDELSSCPVPVFYGGEQVSYEVNGQTHSGLFVFKSDFYALVFLPFSGKTFGVAMGGERSTRDYEEIFDLHDRSPEGIENWLNSYGIHG